MTTMVFSRHMAWALAGAACLATGPALAQQKLIAENSEIAFVSKQMGVPVEGRFKKFDAQVAFDPAKPATSKVAFTVDTSSATLGVRETDAELPKAVWFNVPKFPQATFESTAIKALGGGPVSPYGVPGSARPKAKRFGKGRGGKAKGSGSGNQVVAGPWGGPPTGGPTPLEQAELDVLLDRISAGGIDSLTPHEKERLNALSKRMRES